MILKINNKHIENKLIRKNKVLLGQIQNMNPEQNDTKDIKNQKKKFQFKPYS